MLQAATPPLTYKQDPFQWDSLVRERGVLRCAIGIISDRRNFRKRHVWTRGTKSLPMRHQWPTDTCKSKASHPYNAQANVHGSLSLSQLSHKYPSMLCSSVRVLIQRNPRILTKQFSRPPKPTHLDYLPISSTTSLYSRLKSDFPSGSSRLHVHQKTRTPTIGHVLCSLRSDRKMASQSEKPKSVHDFTVKVRWLTFDSTWPTFCLAVIYVSVCLYVYSHSIQVPILYLTNHEFVIGFTFHACHLFALEIGKESKKNTSISSLFVLELLLDF